MTASDDPASAADASTSRPRRSWLGDWGPVVVGTLPFLVLAIASLVESHHAGSVQGDLAVLELRTRAAAHFQELLGPYSRYGWDHPGPVAFYWAAPFYLLSGDRTGGLAAASAAANLGWITLIIVAARSAAGRAAAWTAAVASLGFAAVVGTPWLREAWNPFQVILPVAAVAVLGAAVWAGVRWALPAAALAATWSVQTHVGTTPAVAVVLLATIGPAAWTSRHEWRGWRRAIVVSAVGTLLLWVPPLFDQFHHPPGNLLTIARFFRASSGTAHPAGQVLKLVTPQLTLTSQRLGAQLASDTTHFRPLGAGEVAVAVALLALVALGAWRALRAGARFRLGCCLAGLAGSVASIAATRSAAGHLLPYFTSFATGIGLVVWLAALLTVTDLGAAAWRRRSGADPSPTLRRALGGGAAALLLMVALVLSFDAVHARSFAALADAPDVTRLAADAHAALRADMHQPVLVIVGHNRPWPQATGIAALLERDGTTVRTAQIWVFLFGYAYRPHGNERVALLVLGASHGRFPRAPAGATFVGQAGTAQVWKLAARAATRAVAGP